MEIANICMTVTTSATPAAIASGTKKQTACWSGVFAISLCVFVLVSSEFMPVSLLTPIAGALHVSEGMVGQGISISGVLAVLTSLSIASLSKGMDRKTLLLILTLLMGISGAVVGLGQTYLTFMFGRALIGVVIGGFWSMSAAMAMRLVPADQVSKALAIFNGGNALATVLAAPLGSLLGATIGWRTAFLSLLPVAMIALVWQWLALPSMPAAASRSSSRKVFKLLKSRRLGYGMAGCAAFFMGQFTLFTYLRPFLEVVTQVSAPTLSVLLLAMGVAGFLGTLMISGLLKRGLYPPLIAIPVLMSAIAIVLIPLGSWLAAVTVLLCLWGLMATATPVGWWSWLAQAMPNDAEQGGGLMVAVIQFAIAAGSTLGGLMLDHGGYQITWMTSAILLWLSAGLTFLAYRAPARSAG
ncbi:MFS transporter [Aquitalea magnusonii]|nr:MFS transporter [Aquitalea magnusonii]